MDGVAKNKSVSEIEACPAGKKERNLVISVDNLRLKGLCLF